MVSANKYNRTSRRTKISTAVKSLFSGRINHVETPPYDPRWKTEQVYKQFHSHQCVNDYTPHLSNSQRRFLLTGLTDHEWEAWLNGEEKYGDTHDT